MIDRETGYDDTPVCECFTCRNCDGEGVLVISSNFDSLVPPWERDFEVIETCPDCKGTGKDSEDCAMHNPEVRALCASERLEEWELDAFDARYGITADHLELSPIEVTVLIPESLEAK